MFASTLLLAAACSAPPADGEQVLQDLDRKITAAKTLRIEFEVNQESDGLPRLLASGVIRVAGKNRFRTEIDFHSEGQSSHQVTICDGTTAVRRTGPSPAELRQTEKRAVPPWYTSALLDRLGRGGTFLAVELMWQQAKDPKAGRPGGGLAFVTDKIALGAAPEKLKEAECWVVDYDLTPGDGNPTAKTRVWVDRKTGLPVRRRMEVLGSVFTATHSAFAIDEKMDEKLFELPK
jgi:outer membrane lipoprotein-sorting protein